MPLYIFFISLSKIKRKVKSDIFIKGLMPCVSASNRNLTWPQKRFLSAFFCSRHLILIIKMTLNMFRLADKKYPRQLGKAGYHFIGFEFPLNVGKYASFRPWFQMFVESSWSFSKLRLIFLKILYFRLQIIKSGDCNRS